MIRPALPQVIRRLNRLELLALLLLMRTVQAYRKTCTVISFMFDTTTLPAAPQNSTSIDGE